jgi:hypothetical protein
VILEQLLLNHPTVVLTFTLFVFGAVFVACSVLPREQRVTVGISIVEVSANIQPHFLADCFGSRSLAKQSFRQQQ